MVIVKLIDGDSKVVLEWVYSARDATFKECKHWLVVFNDSYTIYGLGFNPFDLTAELQQETDDQPYSWPTNEMFHNVVSHLCTQSYESWKIVTVAY